jgi:hypothetical protein
MKLITERNLLYAYAPMDIHNPHKSNLTLPFSDNLIGTTVYEGVWGAEEYMVIDVLSDILRYLEYMNKKPRASEVNKKISRFDSRAVEGFFSGGGLVPKYSVQLPAIPYSKIVTRYDFLRKYGPKKLHLLIERTSKIRLICQYRYKIMEKESDSTFDSGKTKKTATIVKYGFKPAAPQSLFDFEYCLDTLSYVFKFNSGIGALFANNILAAEWEWLPSEIYSLSRNAQNLYRKYLLTKKQGTEIRVRISDIARTLNIMTPNQTARRKAIERYLEELAGLGLIKYKVERGYRQFVVAIEKLVSN